MTALWGDDYTVKVASASLDSVSVWSAVDAVYLADLTSGRTVYSSKSMSDYNAKVPFYEHLANSIRSAPKHSLPVLISCQRKSDKRHYPYPEALYSAAVSRIHAVDSGHGPCATWSLFFESFEMIRFSGDYRDAVWEHYRNQLNALGSR